MWLIVRGARRLWLGRVEFERGERLGGCLWGHSQLGGVTSGCAWFTGGVRGEVWGVVFRGAAAGVEDGHHGAPPTGAGMFSSGRGLARSPGE